MWTRLRAFEGAPHGRLRGPMSDRLRPQRDLYRDSASHTVPRQREANKLVGLPRSIRSGVMPSLIHHTESRLMPERPENGVPLSERMTDGKPNS